MDISRNYMINKTRVSVRIEDKERYIISFDPSLFHSIASFISYVFAKFLSKKKQSHILLKEPAKVIKLMTEIEHNDRLRILDINDLPALFRQEVMILDRALKDKKASISNKIFSITKEEGKFRQNVKTEPGTKNALLNPERFVRSEPGVKSNSLVKSQYLDTSTFNPTEPAEIENKFNF